MEARNMLSEMRNLHAEQEVALILESGKILTYHDIDSIFLKYNAKRPSNLKSELSPNHEGLILIGWVPTKRIRENGIVYISDARQ